MTLHDAALPGTRVPPDETIPCGSHLSVRISHLSAATVLCVRGAVDAANVGLLRAAVHIVLDGHPEKLLIDVTGMSTGSVRGLSVLVDAAGAAQAAGIPYATVGLAPLHARLLHRLWPDHDHEGLTHASLADALSSLGIPTRPDVSPS